MLHILLMILKIIGIILAVILGILVLLFCIVLFIPVRYTVKAECDGTLDGLKADVKVTWLFHIIKAVLCYEQGKADYNVRAAWIKFGKESGEEYEEENEETYNGQGEEGKTEEAEKEPPKISERDESAEKEAEERPGLSEKTEREREETAKDHERDNEVYGKDNESYESGSEEEVSEGSEESESHEKGSGLIEKIKNILVKIRRFFEKAYEGIRKIKCTFYKFCDKIKLLFVKKDKLAEFIGDGIHKAAFLKAKEEVFKLIRKLKPKKFITDVTYGFNDPYLTGQVLAGLSILYPFWGKQVRVTPDFEHQRLEGTLYIKGHIRVIHFVALLWNLVWSRVVRRTYKDIRNLHL